tara:strand:- start:3749 stop:4186 length:438 start_codon:yes stop_codon:yes gene_type:complete
MIRKRTIFIISSNYYKDISDKIEKEALEVIRENNMEYVLENVTGVFEIPAIIGFTKHKFDGYIALGCVIRGETSHYDYVCQESANALMSLSMEGLALGYGILTVDNYDQALARITTNKEKIGKGRVAALACINQIMLKIKYTNGS